jgi:protein-L-isoaspartate(D-aspartate) O-methyltransferase
MLEIERGARVLHVGAGLGYYTAIVAECAGPSGRVVAYEADAALAAEARRNLGARARVEVRHGDAASGIDGPFDAILVNAGVTHPLDAWLDALAPAGRMLLPITAALPGMGSTLGKGVVAIVTRRGDRLSVRIVAVVAVYSALGIRDESMNEAVGTALMAGPLRWQTVAELRRDRHEPDSSCWLHSRTCCFSAAGR